MARDHVSCLKLDRRRRLKLGITSAVAASLPGTLLVRNPHYQHAFLPFRRAANRPAAARPHIPRRAWRSRSI